jgi:PAS domain S-box-containing protein
MRHEECGIQNEGLGSANQFHIPHSTFHFKAVEVIMIATTRLYPILVVEDNQDLVMGLQDLLRHDGYAVTVAGTVASAIELVRAHRFSTILLDLGLPDGDGLDVLKEIQRLDPSLPVVIVTAHTSQDRTVGTLTKGAYAYLTKPYDREELRHTLRRAVGVKELTVKVDQTEHLLSESEKRFGSLVESATDAIIVADGRGIIISWNRSASALFGYSNKEAIGRPLVFLMPERYRHAHEQGLARVESEGTCRAMGSVMELHGLRSDGVEFPIELSLASWKTAASNFYSGIIRDITARKKTEDALRRSEQLLQSIINNTTAVIYVKYANGQYLLINHRFEQLFHLTTDQIVGHTDHEIFPKDIADAFRANDVAVLERNQPVEYEEYAPHSDGLHAYISIKFPLCDDTGKPYATCGISTDISERKRVEDELRAGEARSRLTLTASQMGLWDWDLQTGHIYWSPQVDTLLGLSDRAWPRTQDELLALAHPDDREIIALALRLALDPHRTNVTFEHRVLWPDGSVQWCVWTGEIIRDCDGKSLRVMGTVRARTAGHS